MEPTPTNKDTRRTIEPIATDLEETSVHTVPTNPDATYPRAADDLSDLTPPEKLPLTDDHHKELGRALLTRGGDTDKIKKNVKIIGIILMIAASFGVIQSIRSFILYEFHAFALFDVALDVAIFACAYGVYRRYEIARQFIQVVLGISTILLTMALVGAFFHQGALPAPERILIVLFAASLVFNVWAFAYLHNRDVRRIFA